MSAFPPKTPRTNSESQHPTPVESMTGELRRVGAIDIAARMSVANLTQREIIHEERRFLLTPNDRNYMMYKYLFETAQLPYLKNNPHFGSENVVVGGIPRSARSITQVLYGKQPNKGRTIQTVFEKLGSTVGALVRATDAAPANLRLDQVLILPDEGEVLVLPPASFIAADSDSLKSISAGIREQVTPDAALLDIESLIGSFEQGIHGNER